MEIEGRLQALKNMQYTVLVGVVSDPEFVSWFSSWFSENVSKKYAMTDRVAANVLKSFLVATHFERVVAKGILMHVVESTAKEVVKRLEQWYECRHEIGMCSAIDMFLSTWDNHQRSLHPYDTMASVIQTRFWFSHARWVTDVRIVKYFADKKFTLEHYGTMRVIDREDRFRDVSFERNFNVWIRRLAATVVCKTGNRELEYNPETMSLRMIKMCMFAQSQLIDIASVQNTAQLVAIAGAAGVLEPLVDKCLKGDYSDAENMLVRLGEFSNLFNMWWATNGERIINLMQQHIYIFTYMNFIGDPVVESGMAVELKKRYSYLTSYAEMDEFQRNSPLMRALGDAVQSPMWKSFYTSAQVMHELFMDPDFLFKAGECYPIVTDRYASAPPVSVDGSVFQVMLADMMAATMFSCRFSGDALQCVEVFRLDEIRHDASFLWGGSEFSAYATQVFNFMRSRIGNAGIEERLGTEWSCITDRGDVAKVMCFLFDVAKEVRVGMANKVVEATRAIGVQFRLTVASSSRMVYDKTRVWLKQEIDALSRKELELVHSGDPFMLLRFHDRALVNLVCGGDIGMCSVPEVLELDVSRLEDIRSSLCMVDDNPTMRYVLCELVTSQMPPRSVVYKPVPSMIESAKKLRVVMVVCRAVHGEMTMRLTRSLADDAMAVLLAAGSD